jgi:hypothetical protein
MLAGWVVVIPPIRSATHGFYVGPDGNPAEVAVGAPLFEWTIYGRYQTGSQCDAARDELERRSLHLRPDNATGVACSFARCLKDDDAQLRPDQGPIEQPELPPSNQSAKAAAHGQQP